MCSCSYVATSFLKKAFISSLNVVMYLSNIFRVASWEKYNNMVEASFVTETMAEVALESDAFCLGDCLFFLLSITGLEKSLLMS